MSAHPALKQLLQPLLKGSALCLALGVTQAIAAESIESTGYRVSLFHYFQQDYFDALTELMVAQENEELEDHAVDAELLLGGMALSYGLDRTAETIFHTLLDTAPEHIDRDKAWFYLGKMAWQKGDAERATHAFERMSQDYSGYFAEEAGYLRASVALNQGQEELALSKIDELPESSKWHYYLRYNLGADYAQRAQWPQASSQFDQFSTMQALSAEANALRDRGLTAAGYAYLSAQQPAAAQLAFQQVSLDGPLSERALLGLGWSAAEQGDFQQALAPWQVLAEKSPVNDSARESLLAVPYAYSQLQRPGLALAMYQAAADTFEQELSRIDRAIEAFRSEPVAALLGIHEHRSEDWTYATELVPHGEDTLYLQHLASRHEFQLAARELRDLYNVEQQLRLARERLLVLAQVDEHQQATWQSVQEQGRRDALAARHAELAGRSQAIRTRLLSAIEAGDGRQLANAEQQAQWQRLERAQLLATQLQKPAQTRDKLRIMQGLLIWQDNEEYPALAWNARRELAELETLASQSEQAMASLDQVIDQKQASDFAPRIVQMSLQVQQQSGAVAGAVAVAESGLRQVAIAELEAQAVQLTRALGQSNLAIARLHDQQLSGNWQ